jgi:hypothetical protein
MMGEDDDLDHPAQEPKERRTMTILSTQLKNKKSGA